MSDSKPGRNDPTLGSGDLQAKQLDIALELTQTWLGETNWHAPGNVYDNAKIIQRVFEAFRLQVQEGRLVDPGALLPDGQTAPEAYTALDLDNLDDEDDDEDEDDEDDEY